MVMPKHPVKTVINSFNPQIFIVIDKLISKITILQFEGES